MNANDLKKRLSLIDEESRLALGISRDEYALCSYVYFRAQDTRQKVAGWCCDTKIEVADFCGISRSSFYNVAGKMRALGLLEISHEWFLRPTKHWCLIEQKCKETLQNILGYSVQKLDTSGKKSVQKLDSECSKIGRESAKSVQKLDAHLIREYKEKKESIKAQSSDCLEGVFEDAELTLQGLQNSEILAVDPPAKNRPTPGPARGETSLGAAKPKASEIAGYTFAEFWEDYGFKRGSKANSEKKWDRLTASEITAIRDTLEIYKRETVTEDGRRGDKFKPMRKHPEFFLSAKTWEAYAEQAKEEAARPKDEWDEPYQAYVEWVKRKFPTLAKSASYLTKQQYVCHKTEWYVKGMSYIGDVNIQNMLIRAHEALENGVPKASQCGSVFNYQVHLLEERVKSRTV